MDKIPTIAFNVIHCNLNINFVLIYVKLRKLIRLKNDLASDTKQ